MHCLDCKNSFSLPAGEPFDDGTVCDYDRLVCMLTHELVSETDTCNEHTK